MTWTTLLKTIIAFLGKKYLIFPDSTFVYSSDNTSCFSNLLVYLYKGMDSSLFLLFTRYVLLLSQLLSLLMWFHWPAKLLQVSAVCSDLRESASSFSLGMLPMVQMLSVWKQMCLAWNPMVHGPLQWPLHLCKLLFLGSTAEGMTVPGCCAMYPTVRGAKWNNNNLCSMMERVLQKSLNSCTLFAIPRAAGSILRSAWAAKCCLPPAVLAAV